MNLIDITGKKYNELTVLSIGFRKQFSSGKRIYWKCKCVCGETTYALKSDLVAGKKKSCGCVMGRKNIKHLMCKTKFYYIWSSMKDRCTNPNARSFKSYGGRGIGLCVEWFDFLNFKKDMYSSYKKHAFKFGEKNTTIERIDNNSWYTLENCKWTTYKNQSNNKRSSIHIIYSGDKKTLKEWSEYLNISYSTLYYRLNNLKWSIKKTFETPLQK